MQQGRPPPEKSCPTGEREASGDEEGTGQESGISRAELIFGEEAENPEADICSQDEESTTPQFSLQSGVSMVVVNVDLAARKICTEAACVTSGEWWAVLKLSLVSKTTSGVGRAKLGHLNERPVVDVVRKGLIFGKGLVSTWGSELGRQAGHSAPGDGPCPGRALKAFLWH
jgi:hypothetical protein